METGCQIYLSKEVLEQEIEDAMQGAVSMSNYADERKGVQGQHDDGDDVEKINSPLYAGNPVDRQEMQRMKDLIENYKDVKVHLETKCESYDDEVERLKKKCAELEQAVQTPAKDKGNKKDVDKGGKESEYKAEIKRLDTELLQALETMERYKERNGEDKLNQEVKRLTDLIEDYKKVKFALESKCQLLEDEIKSLKTGYQNRANHKKSDSVRRYEDLEKKFNELQTSNQKLVEDYQGLEASKIVYEEEVAAERERYKTRIKELEDKFRLLQPSKEDGNSQTSHINKLKGENKVLREKLHLIRNESETTDSTAKKEKDIENIIECYSGEYRPPSESCKDKDIENIIKRYSGEYRPPSESCKDKDIKNIIKRYSEEYRPPSESHFVPRQSRSSTQHHSDLLSEHKEETEGYSSANLRSHSLDRLDSSGADEHALSYEAKYQNIPSSITDIPFCPVSVKDLAVDMKISVNRANGRLARGTVKWIGTLPRHSGDYVGVELEAAEGGKHDGNLNGIQYFQCKPDRGIFVKFPKVIMAWKQ